MARSWTLIDTEQGIYEDAWQIGDRSSNFRVDKVTLRGGLQDGVDRIRMDNGRLRCDVLPTRGMSLWKAWLGDTELGWKSPVRGPVHPKFVPVGEPSGLGWLDGFDELLVRCGLESNGAPEFDDQGRVLYPLHGRVGNKPAHRVQVTLDEEDETLAVIGEVEETRFHFIRLRLTSTLTLTRGESTLRLEDRVDNISARPADLQMLYHINLGHPVLESGGQLLAPIETLVPRNAHAAEGVPEWNHYPVGQPGYQEQVYFASLQAGDDGQTSVLLKNAGGTFATSLSFSVQHLPCFTVWKNTVSSDDGYAIGIEPGTNFPNPRSFEKQHDRVVTIPGNGQTSFKLALGFHDEADDIERLAQRIASLQAARPQILEQPQPTWCAP